MGLHYKVQGLEGFRFPFMVVIGQSINGESGAKRIWNITWAWDYMVIYREFWHEVGPG